MAGNNKSPDDFLEPTSDQGYMTGGPKVEIQQIHQLAALQTAETSQLPSVDTTHLRRVQQRGVIIRNRSEQSTSVSSEQRYPEHVTTSANNSLSLPSPEVQHGGFPMYSGAGEDIGISPQPRVPFSNYNICPSIPSIRSGTIYPGTSATHQQQSQSTLFPFHQSTFGAFSYEQPGVPQGILTSMSGTMQLVESSQRLPIGLTYQSGHSYQRHPVSQTGNVTGLGATCSHTSVSSLQHLGNVPHKEYQQSGALAQPQPQSHAAQPGFAFSRETNVTEASIWPPIATGRQLVVTGLSPELHHTTPLNSQLLQSQYRDSYHAETAFAGFGYHGSMQQLKRQSESLPTSESQPKHFKQGKWPTGTQMESCQVFPTARSRHEEFYNELLCDERKHRIKEKHEELTLWIDITKSLFLDVLIEKKIITARHKEVVECSSTNEGQVSELIKIMEKMSNGQYEEICGILDEIGQGSVVRNLLLTSGDITHARQKLANYFLAEFTDIQLYSADKEDLPTKLEKIYVNMTWQPVDKMTMEGQQCILSSYLQLFHKIHFGKGTHLVVTGKPGAGKTTFVKRICHQWAELALNSGHPFIKEEGVEILERYTFVVPIILRLVGEKQTLPDIIRDQFGSLSRLDIHCVNMALEKYPKDVLLILDGYDELSPVKNNVHFVINRRNHKDLTMVLTTRPHGITLIKQLGGNSIDQMAELHGFNDDQIVQYISIYFCNKGKLAQDLHKCIFEERPDLHEIAKIPIHLQMICIVWRVHKNLGSKQVDLYLKFIVCLLDHLERKITGSRQSDEDCLQNYYELLLKVGEVANQWNGSQIKTTFSYNTMQGICLHHLQNVIRLGCITKYHPSSELEKSHWTFTHLTLQEFFVAYFLSNAPGGKYVNEFTNRCSHIAKTERNQVILKFLAGLAPNLTNKILETVIKRTKGKDHSKRLLKVLLDIIPEYRKTSDIDLPIPYYVEVDELIKKSESHLQQIFVDTTDANLSNLHEFTTSNISNPLYKKCLPHICELNLVIRSTHIMKDMADVAKRMVKLASLDVNLQLQESEHSEAFHENFQLFLLALHLPSITFLSMKGTGILTHSISFLSKAPSAKTLSLELDSKDIDDEKIEALCSAIKQKESITEVELELDNICNALIKISDKVKLVLTFRGVTSDALRSFTDIVDTAHSKPGISTVVFKKLLPCDCTCSSHDDCEDEDRWEHEDSCEIVEYGKILGRFIFLLPSLTSLDMSDSGIDTLILQSVAAAILPNQTSNMNVLLLSKNVLEGSGEYLAQLLQQMPKLQRLDLWGNLGIQNNDDMMKLAPSLQYSALKQLRLRSNLIDDGAAAALGELWRHVTDLSVLDLSGCEIEPDAVLLLLGGPGDDRLQRLRVLNIGYNHYLRDAGVRHLASRLPSLPSLQALCVAGCGCEDVDTLHDLVTHLSPSLTHLDVLYNWGPGVVQVTQHKERLAQLQRLNMGHPGYDPHREETVEAVRQELLTINPDIHVYCDNEDMWKMYVDTKED